ncbi:MAG: 16S rRNA (cytosine(1402)-N(4))-methyltransferase RsmH [Nitrospinae bacterium]|nr:16S rRNA (cytosine(1402)-N(4))-methyltransferase RsmH [Nitrospinota bacterium]
MAHIPVLLNEVLSFIGGPQTGIVADATIGGGGHAEAILRAMGMARVIGLDQDGEAVERVRARLTPLFPGRIRVEKARFDQLGEVLDRLGTPRVDAALFDLGVSSFHLDDPARGFSFLRDGPLDMRMDRDDPLTAADIVNHREERELSLIFRQYGEERHATRIARAIVRERARAAIETTGALAEIVAAAIPARERRASAIHPATRVFQALRIAVNRELEILDPALRAAAERLSPGGRIAVISFHSLEDRIVKRAFADMEPQCRCPKDLPVCRCGRPGILRVLTRKPVAPGSAEVEQNPRARSARLRVAERLSGRLAA